METPVKHDKQNMRVFVPIRKAVLASLSVAVLIGAAILGFLIYPEPLYAYHASTGNLRIYSDRPFDDGKARQLLADVEHRLAVAPAPLQDTHSTYRVFVSNDAWRRRLTFLWKRAGGVNYYPIAHSVFLRQADIDANRIMRSDGAPVAPPRTLAYFAAHEIGHSLIGKRIGALANWRLRAWVREGLADYIAFGGDVDIDDLTKRLRMGDPDLDPHRSGLYARYRLLVAYLLDREGWTVDQLLAAPMALAEAEQRLLSTIKP